MKKNLFLSLIIFLFNSFQLLIAEKIKPLCSPNRNLEFVLQLSDDSKLSYSFKAAGKLLIDNSPMGYLIEDKVAMPSKGWFLDSKKTKSVHSVWKPVWGKRALVPEKYKELILNFKSETTNSIQSLQLEVRAYNDGIAFRYSVPSYEKNSSIPSAELTSFNFAADYSAWFTNGENANIGPEKLSETSGKRLPVMTIMADKDIFMAIHEANLITGNPLVLNSKKNSSNFSILSVPSKLQAGFQSAWRVIMYGKTPGALVDSHLIELLNPPAEGDFSWVKPGVAVWDWRINGAQVDGYNYGMDYPSWVRMIDFAAEKNIRHLVLDANWYGPEHQATSDPVKGDKAADVMKIIKYGQSKNIGVWLYLNDVGGRKYPIEETLKQYSQWGASGIKYGFMNGSPSEKNIWTRRITELCAKYHLLCNFHDGPVHPYGQMRTFPNAVTREFCQAQLDAHRVFPPSTFVSSVFVNMVAGPIDMNNGMFDLRQGNTTRIDENKPVPSTVVSEAARTLIVFSGATIIPDVPEYYKKYPELLQFIAAQQMPWLESKTLGGEIGKYIVMARQASDKVWLVGAATNEEARDLDIPLSFLGSGKFKITIVQDGDNAHYLTNREVFKVQKQVMKSKGSIHVKLAPGGGACLIIKQI